jgi:alkylation response protein AidB-like acyl-CoA dehydrogenase
MIVYQAPLEDLRFLLYELLDYERTVASLPGYPDAGRDVVDAVLSEAARLCEYELLPRNKPGDIEGCSFANGVVRTPSGFKEVYEKFTTGGWIGLACAREHGGQGLPVVLELIVDELIASTNLSFGTYPGLSMLAYKLLARHGNEEHKRWLLPRLVDGTWSGTMCLTEPHCGSDLGLIRTKAEPNGQQTYRITGTKIFVTGGEQDLTENIIHLVLARLPEAPSGTSGLSLFIVPKHLVNPDGTLGPRNSVSCASIEKKMGIRASATCLLNFDGAQGHLVGEPHKGMQMMFTMMNAARLAVGIQGLGLAETAYQSATAYARERLQGRSLSGPKHGDQPADPIIVHPDVRKQLLTMRAYSQGARALALWVGLALDVAARHADAAERAAADELVGLMTPIVKAFFSDCGFEATNLGLQVFGGAGYLRDTGMEQLVRDARVAQIYEGTNGIQALDLAGRKLPQQSGRLLRRFFHPAQEFIEANQADPQMQEFVLPFAQSFSKLREVTLWIAQEGLTDRDQVGAAASDYLRMFGLVVLAYMWARMAKVALGRLGGEKDGFYRAKVLTARFYMSRLLPQTQGLLAAVKSGAAPIMEFREEWF